VSGEATVRWMPPVERYAGLTVDIPGGSIELGLERDRGESVIAKRAEMRRICEEEALVLNGDGVSEDSAAELSDSIDARFRERWPGLSWFVEIWNERERLTQVYAPRGMPRTR
jgi:hypothetical protein